MANKRLFISDVHVGAKRYSEESKAAKTGRYKFDWDWLSEAESANFVSFLTYLCGNPGYKNSEVVLVGDIFDNWIFPHDLVPPSMDELIETPANQAIRNALETLSQEQRVFYLPGNHDMAANRTFMQKYFPKVTYCPDQFRAGRLIAEHGHRYAIFNAPPSFSRNLHGLPLGYYISRLEATRKAATNRDGRSYRTYVDDFLELFTKATLPQCVFEAVLEETKLTMEAQFLVKLADGSTVPVKAADVWETYKDIYADWPTSVVSKPRAIMAELDKLGPIADLLCKNGSNKVCIFGHSHKAEIDKDTWFCDDRIYANAGYWCGSQCTFVEVEDKYTVRLMKWSGGSQGVTKVAEEKVK